MHIIRTNLVVVGSCRYLFFHVFYIISYIFYQYYL